VAVRAVHATAMRVAAAALAAAAFAVVIGF
jgi:hypothetical protein